MWDLRQTEELQGGRWKYLLLGREVFVDRRMGLIPALYTQMTGSNVLMALVEKKRDPRFYVYHCPHTWLLQSDSCALNLWVLFRLDPAALSVTKFFSNVLTSAKVTGVNVHSASSLSGPKGSALVRPGWWRRDLKCSAREDSCIVGGGWLAFCRPVMLLIVNQNVLGSRL